MKPTEKALLKSALFMLVSVAVSASAANTAIQTTTVQAQQGKVMLFIYYENANAASGSAPLVNTGTTRPTASGSYPMITPNPGHLWTPQYMNATNIPAGDWTFNIWETSSRSGSIIVSVYTTDTEGRRVSTILSDAVITVTTAKTEATATFFGSAGTIPSGGGYIEVIVKPTGGATVTMYWGSEQLTNFQLQYP
jgi:uncharacterized protein (DUF2141 family)